MAQEGQPPHLMNSLCTALAICIMHMRDIWQDFMDFILEFQDSVDLAICQLMILKYMASDCDNDSIVIEESVRGDFFQFLDEIAPQVFDQVFNAWSIKLLAGNLGQIARPAGGHRQLGASTSENEREQLKIQKMRSKLVEAFQHWIKIRLPASFFQSLADKNEALLQLTF